MTVAARIGIGLLLLPVALAAIARQPAPGCKVDPFPRSRKGETVLVKMHVVSDGTACAMSPQVGSGKAESLSILAQPKNGQLVSDGNTVRYTATPGFSGATASWWSGSAVPPVCASRRRASAAKSKSRCDRSPNAGPGSGRTTGLDVSNDRSIDCSFLSDRSPSPAVPGFGLRSP